MGETKQIEYFGDTAVPLKCECCGSPLANVEIRFGHIPSALGRDPEDWEHRARLFSHNGTYKCQNHYYVNVSGEEGVEYHKKFGRFGGGCRNAYKIAIKEQR